MKPASEKAKSAPKVSSRSHLGERVPRLRFPGFEGEWEFHKAECLFAPVADKNHPQEEVLTIIQGFGTVPRKESGRIIRFDAASVKTYKRVQKGDFIIHLRSFEGGLEKANENGIVSPAYTIIRSKHPIDVLYYDAYFHTDKFINHILAKSVEGIRDGRQISYEAFKWLLIPKCQISEQKKIGAFLSILDARISAQRKLVELLKKLKRGLLQSLFADKSGTPKLRFRGFEGNWEWMSASKLFTPVNDKPYQIQTSEYHVQGKFDVVDQGKNAIVGRSDLADRLFTSLPIIVFGDHTTIVKYREKPFIVGGDGVKLLACCSANNCLQYLFYALLRFGPKAEGYKRHFTILKEKYLPIPTKDEQRPIADFFALLDTRIVDAEQELPKIETIKRGLLQALFV